MNSATAAMGPQVTIASGSLVGQPRDATGILAFKGIPYAAPPIGALRWRPPQAPLAWAGERDATRFGARCWASAPFGGPIATENVSEDCLFLNIWTGAGTRGAKLPVMVFIHGGGFQFGSGSEPYLDGTRLAKKGVVLVTFNYRLGVFGFLAHPDLGAESGGRGSGMYGIQDQIAALRWVRQNIAAFGGDPDNVTVFGESAGAHAVGILMASPQAAGLFQKAIGQSGAFWESENGEMKTLPAAEQAGLALSARLRAVDLTALRAVPAAQLQAATAWTFASDPAVAGFSPIMDGQVLPNYPYQRYAAGRQNDVPLLAGWNANEGSLFSNRALPHKSVEEFESAATKTFGAASMASFQALYPAASPAEAAQSAMSLVGDQVIKLQTWNWVRLQKKAGRSPVWVYHFEQTSPYNPVAAHITDVPYVFGNLAPKKDVAPGTQDLAVSDAMQSYWTQFARTGNPNGAGLPAWPAYEGAGGQTLRIGQVIEPAPEEGLERFEFLDSLRVNGLLRQPGN